MNNSNSQKLILPYTIFKRNLTLNENIISGSENSYSSTYNSSSRTRLFSENTIKNHPLLINKDNSNNIENNNFLLDKDKNNYLLSKESILSKFQSNRLHYIRNNINKVKRNNSQRFTNSSSKNYFLKKDNEKSRSCLRLFSINPKEHSISEKTLTFLTTNNNNNNNINNINKNNIYQSRNLINKRPIKLLSFDDNHIKPSNNNSNYSFLENKSLSTKNIKRFSVDAISVFPNLRKAKKAKSEKSNLKALIDLKLSNYSPKSENENQNIQNNYIPIFKRKKSKESKKKRKTNRRLTKISEFEFNGGNTNKSLSNSKILSIGEYQKLGAVKFFDLDVESEKYINQRRSFDFHDIKTNEKNKIYNQSKFFTNQNNYHSNKNLIRNSYLIIQDEHENDFQFNDIIEEIDYEPKDKAEKFIHFLEKDIDERLNVIHDVNFHKQNNFIDHIMEDYSKKYLIKKFNYIERITSNLFFQNINDNIYYLKNEIFNPSKKYENYLINKMLFQLYSTYFKISQTATSYIFDHYFSVSLPIKIFKEHFFEFDFTETNKNTLFINYKIIARKKSQRNSSPKKKNNTFVIMINHLPKEDFYYLLNFYQIDYEYFIIPHFTKNKFSNIKLKQMEKEEEKENTVKLKNKFHYKRFSRQITLKNELANEKKHFDKNLLRNALKKNNFFCRKNIIKKSIINIYEGKRKSSRRLLRERNIIEKKQQIEVGVNKLTMISRANDLKQEMLKKLNSRKDEIIFFIKDRNYPGFISLFEKYKISPDMKDQNGNSLLGIAVQSNSFQIANYLLNIGADPNIRDNNNNTPLHIALTFHNYEIADMLIERGADEKLTNKMGITPWQCLDSGHSII